MNALYDYPRRHAITVEEYLRMREARVFAQGARIELIDGVLMEMAPTSSARAYVVGRLAVLLHEASSRAVSPRSMRLYSSRDDPQQLL